MAVQWLAECNIVKVYLYNADRLRTVRSKLRILKYYSNITFQNSNSVSYNKLTAFTIRTSQFKKKNLTTLSDAIWLTEFLKRALCIFVLVHKTHIPYQLYTRTRLYNPVIKEITERFYPRSILGSFPSPGQDALWRSLSRISLLHNKSRELKLSTLLYSEWKLRIITFGFCITSMSLRCGAQVHSNYV